MPQFKNPEMEKRKEMARKLASQVVRPQPAMPATPAQDFNQDILTGRGRYGQQTLSEPLRRLPKSFG